MEDHDHDYEYGPKCFCYWCGYPEPDKEDLALMAEMPEEELRILKR